MSSEPPALSQPVLSARLVTHLPTPLAVGLRAASARVGTPGERLSRRLTFFEGVLRFLVAVQEIERCELGLSRPPAVLALVKRLDKPTLGLWAEAATALTRALEKRRDPGVDRLFPGVGIGLLERGEHRGLAGACSVIIRVRNDVAHASDLAALPDGRAQRLLDTISEPLRTVVRSLDPLCALQLVVACSLDERDDDRWAVQVQLHRGEEPATVDLVLERPDLRRGQPSLITASGRVLQAGPWLVTDLPSAVHQILVLDKWEAAAPWWSAVCGAGGRSRDWDRPADPVPGDSAEAWLDRTQRKGRDRRIGPDALAALAPSIGADHEPNVRRCKPVRLLGRGGTGSVWLVEDGERQGKPLALKILHPSLAHHREHIERLRVEHAILQDLCVTGVVGGCEIFFDDREGPCLLMDWIDGDNLSEVIRRGPCLSPTKAVAVVLRLLSALGQTHARGIVHRDIKPSNIILAGDQPWLIDFGIARTQDGATLTATADVVGTLAYAAPEQLRGHRAGPAADLYGVGRVLQELMLGLKPTPEAAGALPGPLQRVLRKALRDSPERRFGSAEDMAMALIQALEERDAGCALGPDDDLPGGLRVVAVQEEIEPGVFLLDATLRRGVPAAVLSSRCSPGERGAFHARLGGLPKPVLVDAGCPGVRTTPDGIPYAEISAQDSAMVARRMLGLLDGAEPVSSKPALEPGEPLADASVAPQSPAAPGSAPLGKAPDTTSAEAVFLALGAAAAGAVAAHAVGNAMTGKAASGQAASGKAASGKGAAGRTAVAMPAAAAGLALAARLFQTMVAPTPLRVARLPGAAVAAAATVAKAKPKLASTAQPAASDPLERSHHVALVLLALEQSCGGLTLSSGLWRKAWGTRLGGLMVLNRLADRSSGPFGRALVARPDRASLLAMAVELSRTRGGLTAAARGRLDIVTRSVTDVIRAGVDEYRQSPAISQEFIRRSAGDLQVRSMREADGWTTVDLILA